MVVNQALAVFLFFSGTLAALQALGEVLVQRRQTRHYLGALVYLCLAVALNHAAYYLVWRGSNPHFYQAQIPFTFVLGPAVYQYFLISLELQDSYKRSWWWQYLPAGLVLLYMFFYYLEPAGSIETRMAAARLSFWDDPPNWIFALGLVHTLLYFVGLSLRLATLVRNRALRQRRSVQVFVAVAFYALCLSVLAIVMLLTGTRMVAPWVLGGMALVVPGLYLLGRRYPDFLYGLTEIVRREKYNQSHLRGVPIQPTVERLVALMESDELFREEDLSLQGLAARLDLTPHQLSELFNAHLQRNFASFINPYRIEAACQMMRAEPERTILSIAYESGFSSRSAFQNAFLKQVGMSPSRYRKQKQM